MSAGVEDGRGEADRFAEVAGDSGERSDKKIAEAVKRY
jgi:hypothetical protein